MAQVHFRKYPERLQMLPPKPKIHSKNRRALRYYLVVRVSSIAE